MGVGELELESELTLLRPAVMKGFMNINSIQLQPSHAISACMAVPTHDVYVYIQTSWCRMLEREYNYTVEPLYGGRHQDPAGCLV